MRGRAAESIHWKSADTPDSLNNRDQLDFYSFLYSNDPRFMMTGISNFKVSRAQEQRDLKKVIELAAQVGPLPQVPESARENFLKGSALIEAAKNERDVSKLREDYRDAAGLLESALRDAPWLANAWYNLGVANDVLGFYDNAIEELQTYLKFNPQESNAEEARTRLYVIEGKKIAATGIKVSRSVTRLRAAVLYHATLW